ncbi:MAG: AAA family ATPase [Myxococcota bacterium]
MEHTATETARATVDSFSLSEASMILERLTDRLKAAVQGRDREIELIVIALMADGHVLLEDFPGSGKTTLARALGESIVGEDGSGADEATLTGTARHGLPTFRRLQFTPDLLPSDITGTNVFEPERGSFQFRAGPIFAHVVLADEINRTSPKVQAAMLEAMAEKQITVDDRTHPLGDLFFVIATQNPHDLAGTYPLPTPQLDRFLFKIKMTPIDRESELLVLQQYPQERLALAREKETVSIDTLVQARSLLRSRITVAPWIKESLVDFARAIRSDERVLAGASTRSLVLMLPALQARALKAGRDYVSPEDFEALAPYVFEHRIECAPGVEEVQDVLKVHLSAQMETLAQRSLRGR